MRFKVALSIGFVALASVAAAADLPYVGKWKMNPVKSDFGETTMTFEQLPSGEIQMTSSGQSYKFKVDGKDHPAFFGTTASWKALSPTSWETTTKLNGKVITTDTLTLSSDGNTLTTNTTGTKPNGEKINDTAVSARVSGSSGLTGKWKTKNMKSASPSVLEFAQSSADGLLLKIVDIDLTCNAKLDGKDHPCSGPTLGPGWAVAFGNAAKALDMTVKNNGKVAFKMSYTVSADGKTLTETGVAAGTTEKTKVVYDRQ